MKLALKKRISKKKRRAKAKNMKFVINQSAQKVDLKKEENTLNLEAERHLRNKEALLREGRENIQKRENIKGVNQVHKKDYITRRDRDQKKKEKGKDPDLKKNIKEKTEENILKVQNL